MVCIWSKGLNPDLMDPTEGPAFASKITVTFTNTNPKNLLLEHETRDYFSVTIHRAYLDFLVYAIMQRPIALWDRPVHIHDCSRLFYKRHYNPQQQHLLIWCERDLANVWFVGWPSNANRRTGAQLEQLLKLSLFLLRKEKAQWALMCEREKKNLIQRLARKGQKKVGNLLGGQANWKAYIFLQIRQAHRVHTLWGTWPTPKWDIQNTTARRTRRNERKTSVSQQSSTVGSEFTVEGKVSRQPLFSDDCWVWRDISKGQLKKQRLLEQQQTLPSWESTGQSMYVPVLLWILKNRRNSKRRRDQ